MLSHHVVTLLGERVLIRPLKPSDAALYPDFLTDVTQDDLRLRFFSTMRELSPEMIDKLVHYNVATTMAYIAIEEASGRMLGVVRLHSDGEGEAGEFAILVRTHLKGHGLGWLLMKHMINNAKAKGFKFVRGQVLAENHTMLQMCGELGFHASNVPLERGVKKVTLPLYDVPAVAMA